MAKKNSKEGEEPKFVVKKRVPKEKPNFFQNIPSLKHPLAQIFDFPSADEIEKPNLDIQVTSERIVKDDEIVEPNPLVLDSQLSKIGYPKPSPSAIQNLEAGYPVINNLDSQSDLSGYPNPASLDSLIAKDQVWIAKNTPDLDSKISKVQDLDSQKSKKTGKWKKYDGARSRKGIFLRTDDELTKQFKQFCIAQDIDFSQGTELAWTRFMTDLDIQTKGDLDIKISLNNKQVIIMWKSKPFIINLYYQYNQFFSSRVRWTAKDDRTGQNYNDVDPRIIELGIIQTQCNLIAEGVGSTTTINGFQYYTNEIKKFMMYEGRLDFLDAILKINRETWAKQTGKTIEYMIFNEMTGEKGS